MKPIDDQKLTLAQAIARASANCGEFDHAAHEVWLRTQPEDVQRAARQCPPNRLYRVSGWGAGTTPFVYIDGYKTHPGEPVARCIVRVIGAGGLTLCAPCEALSPV
jgi:hypothetical protein